MKIVTHVLENARKATSEIEKDHVDILDFLAHGF